MTLALAMVPFSMVYLGSGKHLAHSMLMLDLLFAPRNRPMTCPGPTVAISSPCTEIERVP